MKKIINLELFKGFRRRYVECLLESLEENYSNTCSSSYICNLKTRLTFYIKWYEIKEIKEKLQTSTHVSLRHNVGMKKRAWFLKDQHRVAFLEECLNEL